MVCQWAILVQFIVFFQGTICLFQTQGSHCQLQRPKLSLSSMFTGYMLAQVSLKNSMLANWVDICWLKNCQISSYLLVTPSSISGLAAGAHMLQPQAKQITVSGTESTGEPQSIAKQASPHCTFIDLYIITYIIGKLWYTPHVLYRWTSCKPENRGRTIAQFTSLKRSTFGMFWDWGPLY